MDDKYEGCNKVESVITEPANRFVKKAENFFHAWIVQLCIAVVIVGFVLVLHYCGNVSWIGQTAEFVRRVFCYDIFGRTEFGIGGIFG